MLFSQITNVIRIADSTFLRELKIIVVEDPQRYGVALPTRNFPIIIELGETFDTLLQVSSPTILA